MKKVVFPVILVVIALALGAIVILDRGRGKNNLGEWKPESLVPANTEISEIVMQKDKDRVVLKYRKQDDAFFLVEPIASMTDPIMMQRLLGIVLEIEKKKLIDFDPADLVIYGLKPPEMTLTLKLEGRSRPIELEVGKENYSRDSLFAKMKGDRTVFLIPLDLEIFQNLDVDALRARSLLTTVPMNVASIDIKILAPELKARFIGALQPKLVVQKQAAGGRPQWVIVEPIQENADFKKIDNFFQRLRFTNAQRVIDVKPADLPSYGLDSPRAVITLTFLSGPEQKILFGGPKDDFVYAMNSAQSEVILVSSSYFMDLILFSGREETLLTAQREILPTEVSLTSPRGGGPALLLKRKNNNPNVFLINDDPEARVRLDRLRAMISLFRQPAAFFIAHREPYPREPYGLAPPRFHIQVREGDETPLEVAIGDTVEINGALMTYVEDLKRKAIVVMPGDLLTLIPHTEKELTFTRFTGRQKPK